MIGNSSIAPVFLFFLKGPLAWCIWGCWFWWWIRGWKVGNWKGSSIFYFTRIWRKKLKSPIFIYYQKLAIVRRAALFVAWTEWGFQSMPEVTETREKEEEMSLFAQSPGLLVNNSLLSQFWLFLFLVRHWEPIWKMWPKILGSLFFPPQTWVDTTAAPWW